MEQFSQFVVNNWQFISTVILTVLTIILAVVKKRPITEIVDNGSYKDLIILIKEAESRFGSGHGKEKLEWVISSYCNLKNLNKDSWNYESIKALIENVLTTPERKEKN